MALEIRPVGVEDIVVPQKRMRIANSIEPLAGSIRHNGLLHAITLRRDGESLILIAGYRRLQAVKYLHQDTILAKILDVDEAHALFLEIDENLQRAELTELQRSEHLAERKRLWESFYPQTKHGGTPGKSGGGKKRRGEQHAASARHMDVVKEEVATSVLSQAAVSKEVAAKEENFSSFALLENGAPDRPLCVKDDASIDLASPPTLGQAEPYADVTAKDDNLSSFATPCESHAMEEAVPLLESQSSFADETARVIQMTPRAVRLATRIGLRICADARDLLRGTKVEDNQQQLLKLAAMDDTVLQTRIAQLIHDGAASTVTRAQQMLDADLIRQRPAPLPTGPFRVIVVDPPWHYGKRDTDWSKRENLPYAAMTLEDIKALPVGDLAEPDALLWLWTTNAHLPHAFDVVTAWGFSYKTLLTWDKERLGMGDWLRGQTEHCLLCARGTAQVVLTNQSTLLREARTQHSKKPEAFYALVETLCAGSRVELFARGTRDGWVTWGNFGDPL